MKKIDYEKKAKLLSSKEYNDFKKFNRMANQYRLQYKYNDREIKVDEFQFEQLEEYFSYQTEHNLETLEEYYKLLHSQLERTLRLKKRITKILTTGPCLFLTLTFNEYSLEHNSAVSRRTAVRKYLKSFNAPYVGNIDFGKRNGREHYHAVIGIDKVDYSKWTYGAINGIKIRNETDDLTRISKYIAKLTNHAIKETTKRSVIIYSR